MALRDNCNQAPSDAGQWQYQRYLEFFSGDDAVAVSINEPEEVLQVFDFFRFQALCHHHEGGLL